MGYFFEVFWYYIIAKCEEPENYIWHMLYSTIFLINQYNRVQKSIVLSSKDAINGSNMTVKTFTMLQK